MLGSTLGHYRILRPLGGGAMGDVYLALDTRLGREVALKVLPQAVSSQPSRLARFQREAQAIATLNHPNVVTLYSVEEADGVHFLTMEYVQGCTLASLIPRGGLPVSKLIELAVPIADALAAAHERGVIHRDLKPSNVMVSDEGRAKVVDFGLAKLRSPEPFEGTAKAPTASLTSEGQMLGTIPYASPEQLRGEPIDARADIFSFGVLLYEMAAGERPFHGASGAELVSAMLRDEPRPLGERRRDLPPRLDVLVRRCLEKEPRRRWQSALDLRRELEDLVEGTALRGAVAGVQARRVRWPFAVVAAVAILAAAVVGVRLLPMAPWRTARAPIRSLAVLPFANLMKDPAQDYFVEGLHEAVLTDLARLGRLRVISRTSVLGYRDTRKPAKEIAGELNVDAVLEGSVLRSGDRVRITAQLVHGATDEHVWARSYDRDVREVLALLSEVSGAIAHEIDATVSDGPRSPTGAGAAARPIRPEVYEAYLLAQNAARPFGRQGLESAISLYRRATALDPDFAPPWGGIAFARVVQAVHGYVPAAEALPEAREAARRALALDDRLASAHSAQGLIALYYDWDLAAARRTIERAVALNPSDSGVRQAYADYLLLAGRGEEGLEQGRIGRQYDPLWPTAHYLVLYQAVSARRYDEAIAEGRRMLETFPESNIAHWPIGLALWLKGRHEEALDEWRARRDADQEARLEWEARFGVGDECLRGLEAAYRRRGPRAGLEALAECTAAKATRGELNASEPATWYAAAGQADKAFEWLERSYVRREPLLLFAAVNPLFDPIRADPRYGELLRRIGLPGPKTHTESSGSGPDPN